MRPLAEWWSRFVTADGAGFILGRMAAALAISVLFFPFGVCVIVVISAFLLPMPAVLPTMDMKSPAPPEAPQAMKRLFGWTLALPTLIGSTPSFLDPAANSIIANTAVSLAQLSLFQTSLPDWLSYYSQEGGRRGPQYVLSAVAVGYSVPVLYAHYGRWLNTLNNGFAGSFKAGTLSKKMLFYYLLFALFAFAGPFLYFVMLPENSYDLGLAGPGVQLTTLPFPAMIGPGPVQLLCCFPLGALFAAARVAIFPDWNVEHRRT